MPKGAGSIITFGVKGGRDAGKAFIENVKLASHLANVGDAKTLIIHPATTTHSRIDAEALIAAGITEDMVRISVGIEDVSDIQDDFNKGLKIAFEDMEMPNTLMDIQAAVDAMTEYGKVGVVGYCFGGLLTWLSACTMNSVSAGVSYYGGGISGEASRVPLCPVMMHFGDKDAHIPLTDVDIIKSSHGSDPDPTTVHF